MRVKPSKDEEFYRAWGLAHPFCACCGREAGTTHHIVKQGRAHEACNLLRLCRHPCHDLAEGLTIVGEPVTRRAVIKTGPRAGRPYVSTFRPMMPKLTIGVCLTLKWINDPAEYDAARLQELRGCRLPDPLPVPGIYLAQLVRARPELAVRILEAADLVCIPRPPEFKR